jgi:long-chain acyl-CoA synthetase
MEQGTIPQLFVAKARQYGSAQVALREKAYGIWQEVSWQQYYEHVCALCLGLIQLGLQRGDKVAVICGNRPEWLYVELAAQSAGAVPVGIFVDSLPHQVKFILDHAEARFVFVEDQEQVDKVLDVRDELPGLERVIVDDTRGLEAVTCELVSHICTMSSWPKVRPPMSPCLPIPPAPLGCRKPP